MLVEFDKCLRFIAETIADEVVARLGEEHVAEEVVEPTPVGVTPPEPTPPVPTPVEPVAEGVVEPPQEVSATMVRKAAASLLGEGETGREAFAAILANHGVEKFSELPVAAYPDVYRLVEARRVTLIQG